MTGKQIGMVRILINKAGLGKQKEDLVWSFSSERTVHLSELDQKETEEIVKYLRGLTGQIDNPSDKMRRKILSFAHELHWELPDGRVDMSRLNNWLLKYSPSKKPLDVLSSSELVVVVSQLESVYKDFLKGI